MSDSDAPRTNLDCAPSPSSALLTPPPHFPIEVCERIIEFVPDLLYRWNESTLTGTLYACCLTCRDWFPRSRFLLYNQVILRHPKDIDSNDIPHFILCLKCNSANGLLVHSLRVHVESPWSSRLVTHSKLSLIAFVLPHLLPNLESIHCTDADLVNVHPRFYTALSRFQTVRNLHLGNPWMFTYDQLVRFIAASPKLTHLYIEGINCHYVPEGWSLKSKRKLAVPHLNLRLQPNHLSFTINWFSPRVTSLEVAFVFKSGENLEDSIRATMGFVQSCGSSLCQLRLAWEEFIGWDSVSLGLLDFSHNTHLRSLQLRPIPIDLNNVRTGEVVRSVGRMLTTVSSSCLDELAMQLKFNGDIPELSPSGWNTMDSALASPMFNHLKRIHVGVRKGDVWTIDHWEFSSRTMALLFPLLASRPAADFTPFHHNTKIVDIPILSPEPLPSQAHNQYPHYQSPHPKITVSTRTPDSRSSQHTYE